MSAGQYGVVVDLDATLDKFDRVLAQAERGYEAWAKRVEKNPIDVELDASDALADIEKLLKKGSVVEDVEIGVEVDDKAALREMSELERAVNRLESESVLVDVNTDAETSVQELSDLQRVMASVDNQRVLVQTITNIDANLRDLQQLRAQLDRFSDTPEIIKMRLDTDQAIAELRALQREIGVTEARAEEASVATGGFGTMLAGIGKRAAGVAGGVILAQGAMQLFGRAMSLVTGAGIGLNAQLESTQIQFETMMGNADKAREHVAFLFEFAKKTPFETAPIIEASRFLQLFGKDALNTTENLTRIGNAAATAQQPIEQLGFWVGRLYSAMMGGQPFGEASMRLQEMGVLTAETRTQLEQMQKAGASGEEIWAVYAATLDDLDGAMEKQAQTWSGLTSTISDMINLTAANLLAPWFEQAKDAMEGLIGAAEGEQFTETMERWQQKSEELSDSFRDWVEDVGPEVIQGAKDAIPVIVDLGKAIATLTENALAAIKPALDLYNAYARFRDFAEFDIGGGTLDLVGKAGGPGLLNAWVEDIQVIQDGMDLVFDFMGGGATEVSAEIDTATRSTEEWRDAFYGFIDANKDAQQYQGNGVKLTEDATKAADDHVLALQAQADAEDNVFQAVAKRIVAETQLRDVEKQRFADRPEESGVRGLPHVVNVADQFEDPQDFLNSYYANFQTTFDLIDEAFGNMADGASVHLEEIVGFVEKNMLTAQEAVTLFTEHGFDNFGDFTDAMEEELANLSQAWVKAFAEGDTDAMANIERQMEAVNETLAVGKTRAEEFGNALNFDISGARANMQAIVDMNTDLANQDLGFWETNLSEAEDALKKLDEAFERGDISAEEYAEKQKNLQWYQERLTAGTHEYELGVVDAVEAEAKHMKAMDDLNQALADKKITQEQYNETVATLNEEYQNATNPQQAVVDGMNNLGTTMKEVQEGFRDLFQEIGLLPPDPIDVEIAMKKDLWEKGLEVVDGDVIQLDHTTATPTVDADDQPLLRKAEYAAKWLHDFDEEKADAAIDADKEKFDTKLDEAGNRLTEFGGDGAEATLEVNDAPFLIKMGAAEGRVAGFNAYVGTATLDVDIAPFIAGIEHAYGFVEFGSPAKRGPFSVLPNWDAIFEHAPDAADENFESATNIAAGYMPHLGGPADQGALSEPTSWGFLFEGLDPAAEEYAKQAAQRVVDFVTGLDFTQLASGDLLEEANDALESLVNARELAKQMGLGDEIVNSIQEQIDAQQAKVTAIGNAMATPLVQGLADSLKSGEAAAQLADFREGVIAGIDISDVDVLPDLDAEIAKLTALRDAAIEAGDPETADRLTKRLVEMGNEAAVVASILNTDVVQAWQANEEAARAAQEAAEAWADTFEGIGDVNAGEGFADKFRSAQLALGAAMASGADPETIRILTEQYQDALDALLRYQQGYEEALDAGLFTQDELFEQASAGGYALQEILERNLLTPEQIKELVLAGDEGVREILDAFFGPEVVAEWEAGWDDIEEASYEQLKAFKPGKITAEWVDSVVAGLEKGRLSVAQAMELLVDEDGLLPEDAQVRLIDTFDELRENLDRALATGEGLEEAKAEYDAFMQFLIAFAQEHGLVVEDILADWDAVRAKQDEVTTAPTGESIGVGGAQGEFEFSVASLKDLLGAFVDDLDDTLTDNLIDLVGAAQEAADFLKPETLAALGEALGGELADLGLSDPFSVGAAVLDQLGLTRADLQAMGLSGDTIDDLQTGLGEDFLNGANDVVDAIDRSSNAIVGAILGEEATGGGGGVAGSLEGATMLTDALNANTAARLASPQERLGTSGTVSGGAATADRQGPSTADVLEAIRGLGPKGNVTLKVSLFNDSREVEELVINTVTGDLRRKY